MLLSRRAFTGSALSAAVALQLPASARAQHAASVAAAITAIGAYAEAHRRTLGLPGMTIGLSFPGGRSEVLNVGVADLASQVPIGNRTLFQIGSISKMMNAALLQQLAAEGRFSFGDRISNLLPNIALPAGNIITVQHLLDHVAGLASDPPLDPPGGLWTAYAPGDHWHYSNTGYAILGKLAEKIGGKPLAELLATRLFGPLGMAETLGAIVDSDRGRFAVGYEPADHGPFVPGIPLEPATWVEATLADGNVASTASDMNRFMRSLADAVQGRGGLGLPPALARAFVTHGVPSDTPGMNYGNGVMHVANGGRSYLHHTGGMVSFSSSLHVDVASGVGAFASANIGYLAEYRPRLVTLFAVDALTAALAGKPLPQPPPPALQLTHAAAYSGRFNGPAGSFDVRFGPTLTIIANGRSAPLLPAGGDIFRTGHPAFRAFSLMFERRGGIIGGASWGPLSYVRAGTSAPIPPSNPDLAKLAGRYSNPSPWFGTHDIVERSGRLWIGTELPLFPAGPNLWRVGAESWTPERAAFADFRDGRPQTFIWSGEKFARRDV